MVPRRIAASASAAITTTAATSAAVINPLTEFRSHMGASFMPPGR
jgi:hypothetical protein